MTTKATKTVVYSSEGPPNIQLFRVPVTQGGHSWEQHIYGSNDNGVGVVAVTTFEEKFLFVSQFRPAIGHTLIEFPRGFGNLPELERTVSQQAILDAERETLEETGIAAKGSSFLGYIWPDSGILGYKIAVVAIEAESNWPIQETDSEVDSVFWLDSTEFVEHLRDGRITDAITLAAYSLWNANRKGAL